MAGRFAYTTKIEVEQSQQELASIFRKHGATQIGMLQDDTGFHLMQCRIQGRTLVFKVQMPLREHFGTIKDWEQEERRRWRVLIATVKLKFDEIEDELTEFDEAFMPNIMLPNGETVGDVMLPRIEEAYMSGQMPSIGETFQRALPPPSDEKRLREVR